MKKSNILKSLTALTLVFGLASCVDPNTSTGGTSSNPSEQSSPSVHEHSFAAEWSKDENHHWHAATCEHADAIEKLVHVWNEGVVTTPATEEAPGVKTFTCGDCGYTKTEEIAQLAHTHKFAMEWSKDETHHWHASTCGHDDTIEKAAHSWNEGVVTTPATEEAPGVMTFTCGECSYTRTEEIAQLPHTHKFAEEWSKDETHHWHASTCGHDDTVTKAEHNWDNGVDSSVVNGIYTTTFTCGDCGQTKVTTTDTKVYTHNDWTQVGDPKSYYFDNNKIYSLNEEDIGDGKAHFVHESHDYVINNTTLGANYNLSVDLKGTYETEVDVEMDAGIVAWYQDVDNYVVIGVKWANWDRAHEIRSIWMNSKVNGQTGSADIWTDGNATYPADGAKLSITKTGKKFEVTLSGCYLGWSKTGTLTVNGTDTETAKAGLYAANDLVEFKNYSAESFEVSTAVVYNAKIDGVNNALALESKDKTFTLTVGGVASNGTYTANGRNVTLNFADGSVKHVKVYDDNMSFEFYTPEATDPNAVVIDGTASRQYSTIKENMTGDFTMSFNYMGTIAEAGHAVKVGFEPWYVDDNNYIEIYIEWSAGDRPHEIREVQVTGHINGQHVGWNDIWCDGSKKLVADGGQLVVVKTGKTFTVKLVSGNFVKEGSATIAALDTSLPYSTNFYAEGDKVSFSKVDLYQDLSADYNVSGAGAESAILRDTGIVLNNAAAVTKATRTGDYTVSFDYMGTIAEAGHALAVGYYAWYIDENNFIKVYIEWSAGDRPHEIRCVQVTGNINGQHVGWNDIWCDGSKKLVGDGGKLTITKTGKTFAVKLVSGNFVKEGSATIAALDTSLAYSTGFYSEGDTITFKNVSFN